MTIRLWTWQGLDFDPLSQPVDSSKSTKRYDSQCPDIRRAYEELDELLRLPPDRKGQYLWCFTTDSWEQHPWTGRLLWPLNVPEESILHYVDDRIWEYLIGSKWVPQGFWDHWESALLAQGISDEQKHEEILRKYRDSFPSRHECLRWLLSPDGPGELVSALVPAPLIESWICAYELCGRIRSRGQPGAAWPWR
jgi:hypothetical protein